MCDCATPATHSAAASRATRARLNRAQGRHPVPWVRRLPRKTTMDVRLCHACHVKSRWMSPSATPAMQKSRNESECHRVPRLPRTQWHEWGACHAKRPWMCDCATPATHSAAASRATRARLNQAQGRHPVPWVRRLPRKTTIDVRLCHACHAQCRGVTRDQGAPKPGPRAPPSAMSEAPATQNDHGCAIVPRLPREIEVDVTKCHACHAEVAKRKWMSPSATPATHPVAWVRRLPRKTTMDVRLCHACHAQCRGVTRDQGAPKPGPRAPPSAMSEAPAACHAKRPWMCDCATDVRLCDACHVIVRRLPREIKVDVTKCHACHAKRL